MTIRQVILWVIAVIVALAVAAIWVSKRYPRIKSIFVDWLYAPPAWQRKSYWLDRPPAANAPSEQSTEEQSKAELERLQKLIGVRKRVAWETDISYHLWNLYAKNFRGDNPRLFGSNHRSSTWYELKILSASSKNQVNTFEFELNGTPYRFVEDEEVHAMYDNVKNFSLWLYDGSGRCLIDIHMKLRIDSDGKIYFVSSDSPRAFLMGDWVKEFVNATLKHESLRKQDIREQKHQERLLEIEELKDKFGIEAD